MGMFVFFEDNLSRVVKEKEYFPFWFAGGRGCPSWRNTHGSVASLWSVMGALLLRGEKIKHVHSCKIKIEPKQHQFCSRISFRCGPKFGSGFTPRWRKQLRIQTRALSKGIKLLDPLNATQHSIELRRNTTRHSTPPKKKTVWPFLHGSWRVPRTFPGGGVGVGMLSLSETALLHMLGMPSIHQTPLLTNIGVLWHVLMGAAQRRNPIRRAWTDLKSLETLRCPLETEPLRFRKTFSAAIIKRLFGVVLAG